MILFDEHWLFSQWSGCEVCMRENVRCVHYFRESLFSVTACFLLIIACKLFFLNGYHSFYCGHCQSDILLRNYVCTYMYANGMYSLFDVIFWKKMAVKNLSKIGNEFKICTFNCNGLKDFKKRKDVFDFLRNQHSNIYFLKETHLLHKSENCIRSC